MGNVRAVRSTYLVSHFQGIALRLYTPLLHHHLALFPLPIPQICQQPLHPNRLPRCYCTGRNKKVGAWIEVSTQPPPSSDRA
eukprot:53996-Pelagomonas_calceolata.AAC.2